MAIWVCALCDLRYTLRHCDEPATHPRGTGLAAARGGGANRARPAHLGCGDGRNANPDRANTLAPARLFAPGSDALQPFAAGLAAALARPEFVCHTRENKELRWLLHYLANGKIIQVAVSGNDTFEIEAVQDATEMATRILKFATPPPPLKPSPILRALAQMTLARPQNGQLGKGRVIQLLPSREVNLLVWKPAAGAKSRSLPATSDNLKEVIRSISEEMTAGN